MADVMAPSGAEQFFGATWTILGFIGAGISVGARLGRGEKVNKWAAATTLIAGAAIGGTCTNALVNFAHIEPFWSGGIAILLGVMAMGFIINAMDGKIPFINKIMGGKNDDVTHS